MMRWHELSEVAQETQNGEALTFCEAELNRSDEFWDELEQDYYCPFEKTRDERSDEERKEDRDGIKARLLNYIGKFSRAIEGEMPFDLPCRDYDEDNWNNIRFILAFDTSFRYFPENEDSSLSDDEERDYLDDETTFRFDVVKSCDALALRGAALAKRIGSSTYRLWTDALIKLGDNKEEVQCKAAEDIVNALCELWADLRTWIYMKEADNLPKSTSDAKKAKK